MYVAHMDEVALLVTEILKDGSLRVRGMGGVDPKIFPAATVTVHTETGDLFGVIGAKPPHLQAAGDQKKSVKWDDLYIDLGMDAEKVKKTVNIGDMVTFHGELIELLNGRATSKTMDDRSCIAVMLDAAERLQKNTAHGGGRVSVLHAGGGRRLRRDDRIVLRVPGYRLHSGCDLRKLSRRETGFDRTR